jgi:hypothetical protein
VESAQRQVLGAKVLPSVYFSLRQLPSCTHELCGDVASDQLGASRTTTGMWENFEVR